MAGLPEGAVEHPASGPGGKAACAQRLGAPDGARQSPGARGAAGAAATAVRRLIEPVSWCQRVPVPSWKAWEAVSPAPPTVATCPRKALSAVDPAMRLMR